MNHNFCRAKCLLCAFSFVLIAGCVTPLATGRLMTTKPVSKVIPADPNTVYYAIRWALDERGYPVGHEDLTGGVIESKWVPVGAGSHYVEIFKQTDFGGADSAYYKLVMRIIPQDGGRSKLEVSTAVKSIVNCMKSTGDKEREIIEKVLEYARIGDVEVTNLGVEE
jgi:hypothetical protein